MIISIVICSLNGAKVLPACLNSVLKSNYSPMEVLVVDNGSTDDTSRVVKEQFPEVKLLRTQRNLGFAGGNNVGINAAKGTIIVLLNDDTEVEPNWLTAAKEAADRLTDWGVMGAKLLYPDKTTIQHAGGLIESNALTQHIGNGEVDHGQFDQLRPCDYVTGAAFFIKREALNTLGLLDDDYFPIYYEEVDYCFRAKKKGFQVYYVPQIKVYHYESRTTDKFSSGFLYKYHRNRIRYVLKNYALRDIIKFARAEAAWLRHNHDALLIKALLKAYLINFVRLPLTLASRCNPEKI